MCEWTGLCIQSSCNCRYLLQVLLSLLQLLPPMWQDRRLMTDYSSYLWPPRTAAVHVCLLTWVSGNGYLVVREEATPIPTQDDVWTTLHVCAQQKLGGPRCCCDYAPVEVCIWLNSRELLNLPLYAHLQCATNYHSLLMKCIVHAAGYWLLSA